MDQFNSPINNTQRTLLSFENYVNTKGSGTDFNSNKNKSVYDIKYAKTGIPSILKAKERREYILPKQSMEHQKLVHQITDEESFREKIIQQHRKREEKALINEIFDLMILKSKIPAYFSDETDLSIRLALILRNCYK